VVSVAVVVAASNGDVRNATYGLEIGSATTAVLDNTNIHNTTNVII